MGLRIKGLIGAGRQNRDRQLGRESLEQIVALNGKGMEVLPSYSPYFIILMVK